MAKQVGSNLRRLSGRISPAAVRVGVVIKGFQVCGYLFHDGARQEQCFPERSLVHKSSLSQRRPGWRQCIVSHQLVEFVGRLP